MLIPTVDYCSVTHRLNLTQSPHSRSQPDPVTTQQISTQSPHNRSQPSHHISDLNPVTTSGCPKQNCFLVTGLMSLMRRTTGNLWHWYVLVAVCASVCACMCVCVFVWGWGDRCGVCVIARRERRLA